MSGSGCGYVSGSEQPARIMVFAPAPELTITVEERGGEGDIHLHAGGQGVWQARTIASLGVPVDLVVALGGETGQVVETLLANERVTVHIHHTEARTGGYVHDRRGGARRSIVEAPSDPLGRHDLDALHEMALVRRLEAGTAVLSGPAGADILPADNYRRLAADLRSGGCAVYVDLAGDRLDAVLESGVEFLKVSHEELLADRRADGAGVEQLRKAMLTLHDEGADTVLVSRAAEPALALLPDGMVSITGPQLEIVDSRGAGDSMTGAVASARVQGMGWKEALQLGTAAGALNVTRRGLGTSAGEEIRMLSGRVRVRPVDGER